MKAMRLLLNQVIEARCQTCGAPLMKVAEIDYDNDKVYLTCVQPGCRGGKYLRLSEVEEHGMSL